MPLPTASPLRIAVLVGSTRDGRLAPSVARWFTDLAASRDDVELDVVDLVDLDLPPAWTPVRDAGLQAFAARIDRADGFVVVTPEYNHSYPAPLKHAIDLLKPEWRRKAVAYVSYGGVSGGLRAVEHLRGVFAEVHATSIRESVSLHLVRNHLGEDGAIRSPEGAEAAVALMLDDLVWWASALRTARNADAVAAATREDVA